MQTKDYITISISIIALFFSFGSLLFTFLNFRRNTTKLKVEQINFAPNPFGVRITPNKLFLDQKQSPDLWTVVPIVYLIIYLKIFNLSHTGITISNFIINDEFLVSRINSKEIKEELSLTFLASDRCYTKELEKYSHAVPMSASSLNTGDFNFINIGDRIEPKSSAEGIIVVLGNWNLYNSIKDGENKLTIVTPDKKFNTNIEIDKTVIPNLSKDKLKSE
ncbi:MAG: hypothetical protein PWR19_271 [Carnobacterium sp.]|uniref:hypothetical protein n=1 Tax=Carnobacterium sp. TaxID=48221 RepID=UPI0026482691|nr:hypothetical protein [Carnobacterium sp.]MDN5371225.1 hypothetical protein [Carnobacterium sp.]